MVIMLNTGMERPRGKVKGAVSRDFDLHFFHLYLRPNLLFDEKNDFKICNMQRHCAQCSRKI